MLEFIMSHFNAAMPHTILPLSLLLFALVAVHAKLMLGSWKLSLEMLFSGWLLAYAVEEFAIRLTGFYYFTELMGPKLDVIPIALPCLWVAYIYAAWFVTNLILDGSPLPKDFGLPRIIAGAVVGVLVLTAIDLIADPIAVDNKWWVWVHEGKYFGVPLLNFLCGWFPIGGMTFLLHAFQLKREETPALEERSKGIQLLSILPVLFYGMFAVMFMLYNFEHTLGLVSLFALGIPFTVALWKWYLWYVERGFGRRYHDPDKYSERFIDGFNEARANEPEPFQVSQESD